MNRQKLRIGVLIDSFELPAWQTEMLRKIILGEYAEISLVIVNNESQKKVKNIGLISKIKKHKQKSLAIGFKKFLYCIYSFLIERHVNLPDANELSNQESLFQNVPIKYITPIKKNFTDWFDKKDVEFVKSHDLDIMVRLGFRIIRGDIIETPKYGIWSYHHGDNQYNRGGPPGFWESIESWHEIGLVLQILSDDLDNGKVLSRSWSGVDPMSIKDTLNSSLWKSVSMLPRELAKLQRLGPNYLNSKQALCNCKLSFYSNQLYRLPTTSELTRLIFNKIIEKLKLLINNRRFFNQWILMYEFNESLSSSLWRYKKIIPPKDRFWADPHLISKDNKHYIFIEEYIYKNAKGHISMIEMSEDGEYKKPIKILELPYHLSYPFIFEHKSVLYMVPESGENRTIDLYKCVDFPSKWQFVKHLMTDVEAYDTTLFYNDGKWWLFCTIVSHSGMSPNDELFLYYNDDLFSESWEPHLCNPIISDCRSARPAGKIFKENGKIYRPSQNCSKHYGYGFNLQEITCLNEKTYKERLVSCVKPKWEESILGSHTFNRSKNLNVIDAIYKRKN